MIKIIKDLFFPNNNINNKLEYLKQRVDFIWKIILIWNTALFFILVKSDSTYITQNNREVIYGVFLFITLVVFFKSQNDLYKYLKN